MMITDDAMMILYKLWIFHKKLNIELLNKKPSAIRYIPCF